MAIVLLNDGSSAVLLNDGTSKVLLNAEDVGAGITLSGTHSYQAMQAEPKKRLQLIPISYTFHLIAGPFKEVIIKIYNLDKYLNPQGIYSDTVKELFKLNKERILNKLNKMQLKNHFMELYELAISDDPKDMDKLLWERIHWLEEKFDKLGEKFDRRK